MNFCESLSDYLVLILQKYLLVIVFGELAV